MHTGGIIFNPSCFWLRFISSNIIDNVWMVMMGTDSTDGIGKERQTDERAAG